ncbi:MAG: hypothetical protein EAZ20_14450 [Bacteroidetes bacterium]|nr:MAG: hypothetical protein EAZ20_14450 [Bacteroidota bacterium]
MSIYALKANPDDKWLKAIYNSLLNGEARYGWSYLPTADLQILSKKIKEDGWNLLNEDEKKCWQPFLLDIKEGDYIVFINTPQLGQCTLAKVNKPYYFKMHDDLKYDWGFDANHCLGVDIKTVKTFDRNGKSVHPTLSRRLKLQGRYWQIYAEKEFNDLVISLESDQPITQEGENLEFLKNDLQPIWENISSQVHKTHPGKDLEKLISKIFTKMPNVLTVKENGSGWRTDHGADIIVSFSEGLSDFLTLETQKTLVVQVKSYTGEHWSLEAVKNIETAILEYNADCGLILTTAKSTSTLETEVQKLSEKLQKPIAICAGADVGKLVAKYMLTEII